MSPKLNKEENLRWKVRLYPVPKVSLEPLGVFVENTLFFKELYAWGLGRQLPNNSKVADFGNFFPCPEFLAPRGQVWT